MKASNVRALPMRRQASSDGQEAPRRFFPRPGHLLTLNTIRGPWRPSGTVAGVGVFAVIWSTYSGDFWAPLHDFAPSDQLRLIEMCRGIDIEAFGIAR